MKVLVCGSRNMPHGLFHLVIGVIRDSGATHIIAGGANGADWLARAAAAHLVLDYDEFPADWVKYGRAAGPIRNQLMLEQKPDKVIAFHPTEGITPGTKDMTSRAQRVGVPVQFVTY